MKHTQNLSGVRIGPISILVFVIALCVAVMATLAITTARANTASTERQIAFTTDTYTNEAAAQTMLSLVDEALTHGVSGVRSNLNKIQTQTQDAAKETSVEITLENNVLDALFETSSGRQLIIELKFSGTNYEIVKWKTATNWTEEPTEKLWTGES